ncbi:ATP-binding protein [Bartonella sp. HY329]|uniref:ATP-binding protein n=1 Tax=unclassified Bartonella TaxID=2645622 RepID=UPI0021C7FA8E|nr:MULTISPECIES: ATP-binding protein [unclassified Bartonella]UXM94053.1 ATP-binding protein [Bartonella sp. HY329]UXN08375.1 ATP-binding protein [Bartonella sp. HY328]
MSDNPELLHKLDELISVLRQIAPPIAKPMDAESADCFVWDAANLKLNPVKNVNRVDIALIKGVDQSRDMLVENTRRFAQGFAANNVLLWGARGMGKSSLIKSAHAAVNLDKLGEGRLKLVEIHREDIDSLPQLMNLLKNTPYNFILFCDDLSFDHDDTSYKSLKAALDGGIEGRPNNVLFYATSNRRHLMPRDMIDNERSSAINPSEAIEEKVSLSDRFGLWLGFHKCSQDDYLAMIYGYADHYNLPIDRNELRQEALSWATTRGNRSGRVAWQFIQDVAGRLGRNIR